MRLFSTLSGEHSKITKTPYLQIGAAEPPSMAAGATASTTLVKHMPFLGPKLTTSLVAPSLLLSPSVLKFYKISTSKRKTKPNLTVCVVLEDKKLSSSGTQSRFSESEKESGEDSAEQVAAAVRVEEKVARKRSERFTYLIAAILSSLGVTSLAIVAVYYRFSWQMEAILLLSVFCLL